ncbi:spermatogenesis-defective protein 39 homolog isoform X2 [Littorina saxatilis]|uniref:spermatogenesis-defective protein 39 homolog isoform X2 n=1 Tax=Littorina saxatilis TaxID=31220 RepID=UPI0038B4633A
MDADDGEGFGDFRTRKKNIFDDDVSVEAAKKIITSARFDDDDLDDDMEILDLGSSTTSVKFSAAPSSKTMPDLSSLATPASSSVPSPANLRINPSAAEPRHSFGSFQKAAGHVRSQSLTIAPLKSGGDMQFPKVNMLRGSNTGSNSSLTIEEAVGTMGRKFGSMDVDQMQQEIIQLRKQLLAARKERWTKMPVDLTLRRIMKGEPYSLENYRALEDKLSLLDKAVTLMDGNAITAAVLHLKKTVKRATFQQELMLRPVAANHYLAYLRGHFEHAELIDTLSMLGRSEEAAIVKYRLACSTGDINTKVSSLKACLRAHFEAEPSLAGDASLIREHIDLLERQRPIEDSDARLEAEGRTKVFLDFPRRFALVNMPVTTTLFYCCLYHYHLQENSFASPVSIKKRHELPERQFVWTAVSARAKAKGWTDIEQLLTAKGWFGGKKLKAAIGFGKVVDILHRFQAPHDILAKYLELVEDLDTRLTLAKKTDCKKAMIETLVKQKDRAGVEEFARKYSATIEAEYARRVLRDEAIRWK